MSEAIATGSSMLRDMSTRIFRGVDPGLALLFFALIAVGMVMMASASLSLGDRQVGDPMYYFNRQFFTVLVSIAMMLAFTHIPLAFWQKMSPVLLVSCVILLLVLLLPGVGRTVNGSTRWLQLGSFSLQVSEFAKVAAVMYFAAYLNRRRASMGESFFALFLPCGVLAVICAPMVLQPDFGTAVVVFVAVMGMVFLGGVHLGRFILWVVGLGGSIFAVLAVGSPYRLQRLTTFMNPWDDPFNHGFQLTQALIAYGRGGLWGQGLGGGMQKLFYLPESHTDFIHAVIAEELGLAGSMLILVLFFMLLRKSFSIAAAAARQKHLYAAYVAWGVGLFIVLQAVFNVGVSMGALPTKGITLPFISYGNNSMLAQCMLAGLLLRAARETVVSSGGA